MDDYEPFVDVIDRKWLISPAFKLRNRSFIPTEIVENFIKPNMNQQLVMAIKGGNPTLHVVSSDRPAYLSDTSAFTTSPTPQPTKGTAPNSKESNKAVERHAAQMQA